MNIMITQKHTKVDRKTQLIVFLCINYINMFIWLKVQKMNVYDKNKNLQSILAIDLLFEYIYIKM